MTINNFTFPHRRSFKVIDVQEHPYFLKLGQVKCCDYLFEVFRSGYNTDAGYGEVTIEDKNLRRVRINITAGFLEKAIFIENILSFMARLILHFDSSWDQYFQEKNTLEVQKKEWELKLSNVNTSINVVKQSQKDALDKIVQLQAKIDQFKQEESTLLEQQENCRTEVSRLTEALGSKF